MLIEFGARGKTLRPLKVPISQCVDNDPAREMADRASLKLQEKKGYRQVEVATVVPPKGERTNDSRNRLKMPLTMVSKRPLEIAQALAVLLGFIGSTDDPAVLQLSNPNLRCSLELGKTGTIDVSELPANLRVFVSAVAITSGVELLNSKGETVQASSVFRESLARLPAEIQQAVESMDVIVSVSRLASRSGVQTLGF
ncbi:hypothetical protein [Ahniella affigens]|nr:hypothetical protein [Ahniella affigens]